MPSLATSIPTSVISAGLLTVFIRASGTGFGTPSSKPMVLPFRITKSRGKSYATSLKTPPEFEWVAKIMSYSTTRTFNTTVLLLFTPATSQKKIVMLCFGTDSTASAKCHIGFPALSPLPAGAKGLEAGKGPPLPEGMALIFGSAAGRDNAFRSSARKFDSFQSSVRRA